MLPQLQWRENPRIDLRTTEEIMTKLVAIALFVAIGSSAQAVPLAPVQQPEKLVINVREACGAGMHRVNGVCIRTAARRQAARCAAGLRYVGGRCIR
jgi:hypothetical protein